MKAIAILLYLQMSVTFRTALQVNKSNSKLYSNRMLKWTKENK